MKTFTGPPLNASLPRDAAWRRADIGAANGHGNARSAARVQSLISHGGEFDGVRLLTPEAIELIQHQQSDGPDVVIGSHQRFGIGYALPNAVDPFVPQGRRVAYWGGWGGSLVVNDIDARMTFTFMMNRMGSGTIGDDRARPMLAAAYQAIGVAM
jgi:CubicO group peptidase (beta-lactamase class C family)